MSTHGLLRTDLMHQLSNALAKGSVVALRQLVYCCSSFCSCGSLSQRVAPIFPTRVSEQEDVWIEEMLACTGAFKARLVRFLDIQLGVDQKSMPHALGSAEGLRKDFLWDIFSTCEVVRRQ
jgi:hypothetical protein